MASIAYVATLPDCDIHKYDHGTPGIPAKYDAPTLRGPWASMCHDCWVTNRRGSELGTGKGQEYVVGEPPAKDTRAEVDAAFRSGDMDALMEAVGDGDLADWL